MTSAASLPHTADPADLRAEDALYYRRVLHELIDMGTDLARAVHRQATAEDGAAGPAAAAVAFDRLSRAVRRTVALARKVAEPVPVRVDAGQKRALARRQVIRAVEDEIQRTAEVDAEALCAELHERLDGPELDDEIEGRPTAEVIAEICRDLGLLRWLGNHPWKRRRPGDVAALCKRAARPTGGQPAALPPGVVRCAQGDGETWRPQPYTEEFVIELMHKLLEHGPPIRGP